MRIIGPKAEGYPVIGALTFQFGTNNKPLAQLVCGKDVLTP
jgi:hypothetical protein